MNDNNKKGHHQYINTIFSRSYTLYISAWLQPESKSEMLTVLVSRPRDHITLYHVLHARFNNILTFYSQNLFLNGLFFTVQNLQFLNNTIFALKNWHSFFARHSRIICKYFRADESSFFLNLWNLSNFWEVYFVLFITFKYLKLTYSRMFCFFITYITIYICFI